MLCYCVSLSIIPSFTFNYLSECVEFSFIVFLRLVLPGGAGLVIEWGGCPGSKREVGAGRMGGCRSWGSIAAVPSLTCQGHLGPLCGAQ